jgi:AmmeMemoRadiSam system protein A
VIVYGLVSPHPPIILPDIGKDELKKVKKTIASLETASADLAKAKPDEIILISPHEGHGFEVPLFYLSKHLPPGIPINRILVTEPSYRFYYEFGKETGSRLDGAPKRYAIVASGDLSHVLRADGPYGYDAAGALLDKQIVEGVRRADAQALLQVNADTLENGAECGLRSILFLMGALEGRNFSPNLRSYEGPFGVGYLVAEFAPAQLTAPTEVTSLARAAIKAYLETGLQVLSPAKPSPELSRAAGAFVSLHASDGRLRGCIGTITPTKKTLAAEVIANAISAAVSDPRFSQLQPSELADLRISVDILGKLHPVKDARGLNPQRFGITVGTRDGRLGVLLPDIAGVRSAKEQVAVAREKAGIGPQEKISIKKFQVERHEEPASARIGA